MLFEICKTRSKEDMANVLTRGSLEWGIPVVLGLPWGLAKEHDSVCCRAPEDRPWFDTIGS
jgi:hypothetical protein